MVRRPLAKEPADWFTGAVVIEPLLSPAGVRGASVTFEPGPRTAWHTHPLGQTVIVTSGLGWAQHWGGPIEEIGALRNIDDAHFLAPCCYRLTGRVTMTLPIQALHEPYAHLYVGDYFADTLDLSALEHCALRLLLLETWVRGPVGNVRLARVAGLTKEEWQAIKPAVLPLLRGVQPRIVESLNHIRTFDGRRLPSADWHVVRSIVIERDRYACAYCGSDKQLEADHILPLSRGGSNAFVNLATACRPCNLSKGSKAVEEWGALES